MCVSKTMGVSESCQELAVWGGTPSSMVWPLLSQFVAANGNSFRSTCTPRADPLQLMSMDFE